MKHKNISEGVLDVTDEEGWLAKSQLYKIAKYAGELHSMIADTDELEPWMQAKITKAADYMGAVKHYMEYNMVSTVAQEVVPIDAEPVAVVEPEMVPMESKEESKEKPVEEDKVEEHRYRRRRKDKRPMPAPTPPLLASKEEDEEKALDEDEELQATAREFMGNALLKILDEAPTVWRWNPNVNPDAEGWAGRDAERDEAGMGDWYDDNARTMRRNRVAAASRGEDDTMYQSADDAKRQAFDAQEKAARSERYWQWVKTNRPALWASKAFDK